MLHIAYDAAFAASNTPLETPRSNRLPTQIRLAVRETLVLRAQEGESLFRLADGCVALAQYLPDGRRQVCDIVGPGRIFGFTIQGSGQCVAEALTFSTIERFGHANLPANLPTELASMLNRQQGHALLLGRKTASERVASAIIDLAQQFGRKRRSGTRAYAIFPVFPTRADLADWLGLTLETVSRCLHSFKRQRLIRFTRPELISIVDITGLERASGVLPLPETAHHHAS